MAAAKSVPVPDSLAEVTTPEWLTAALGLRFPGVEVSSVVPGRVATRISTNAFLRLEFAGDRPAGLSDHLCAKGYFTDIGNGDFRRAGEAESVFYRDMAPGLGVPTLPCVYADIDPDTGFNVVLTEDVSVAGAHFTDPLVPFSVEEIKATLDLYARLHAATWKPGGSETHAWLAPRIGVTRGVRTRDELQEQFDGPVGALVPRRARDAEGLDSAYGHLPAVVDAAPSWSVIHGDAHVGNTFSAADGSPALMDWQLVQAGPWYIDIGYHIATCLEVEVRRAEEEALLATYLGGLDAAGVAVPGWDEVWAGYRAGIVYGTYLWSITQKVDPAVTTAMLGRLGAAVADHDAYARVAGM